MIHMGSLQIERRQVWYGLPALHVIPFLRACGNPIHTCVIRDTGILCSQDAVLNGIQYEAYFRDGAPGVITEILGIRGANNLAAFYRPGFKVFGVCFRFPMKSKGFLICMC